ncbi:MAG TPA: hypothetical protein VHC49_25650 [Mycobacteriales bacterium]|nr:hypothetical protein [Mycobacteriales bacterium]
MVSDLENARADADVWTQTLQFFDPDAAIAFYRAIDRLPVNDLIHVGGRPLYCFWGAEDEVFGLDRSATQQHILNQRGISYRIYSGLDHGGLLRSIERTAEAATAWLLDVLGEPSES